MSRKPRVTRAFLPIAASLVACRPAHHHDHGEAHAPLVHRVTDPARWSKEFDDPARDAWQEPADIVASMAITPGMIVADIGAGTGYFEPHLARAVGSTGLVVAVDVEPEMVRSIEARAVREAWTNARAQLGAVDDPKLSTKVDRVLIVDTWHHIPDAAAYVKRLRSSLAAGSTLTVVDFTMESPIGPPKLHRIAPDALIGELRAAGFAAERIDLALPYQYVIVARF
jgi:predicted methyltransferase